MTPRALLDRASPLSLPSRHPTAHTEADELVLGIHATGATSPGVEPRGRVKRADIAVLERGELTTARDFASAIARRWQDAVVAIIDMGKLMLRAKATLSHGGFGRMVKSKMVPFGWRTANRLMAIAEHSILANSTHGSHLTQCWRTLAELAAVPAPIIEKWIEEEKIYSELSRSGARKLVNAYRLSQRPKTDPSAAALRDCRLFSSDIGSLGETIPAGSIDAIVTDPPYGKQHLSVYSDLAQVASVVLKDGGTLAVLCSQMHLPEVLDRLMQAKGLSYRWLLCLQMGQKKAPIWGRRMSNWWKPVALFSKGDYSGELVSDIIQDCKALSSEERFGLHEWAQTESSMAAVIEKFTSPGETVLDPFLGIGTTGVAALRLGRRFIGSDIDQETVQVAAARLQSSVDNSADKPVSEPSSTESGSGFTRPGRRVLELGAEVA